MIKKIIVLILVSVTLTIACNKTKKEKSVKTLSEKHSVEKTGELNKAEIIISEAIKTHGGNLYKKASYSFIFRNREYAFANEKDNFKYEVKSISEGKKIRNTLVNNNLSRFVDDVKVELNKEWQDRYAASLNSVIYFALLPYKLNDAAVIKSYVGKTEIKGQTYDVIKVTFNQEGGGEDFNDQFHYWINKSTKTMDYLAYNYNEKEAGVRFRSAYNRRVVDGIIFQDYINYKAPIGSPLAELPSLYEKGKLKELSRIDTENVKVNK